MRILKSSEISLVEKKTIEEIGIPSLVLMENAGRSAFFHIRDRYRDKERFLVVAGSGNNGGDGVVISRYLKREGKNVILLVLRDSLEKLSPDNAKNIQISQKFGLEPIFVTERNLHILEEEIKKCDVIVDAIFGTGFKPPVLGYRGKAIELISTSGKPTVSIDIPSGLDADSHRIFEPSIRADLTITFGYKKPCHVLLPASERCGEVILVDIGLDDRYAEDFHRFLITPENLKFPKREKTGHKYTFGHVGIVGGSVGKSGAIVMSAKASTKAGSGLVSVIVPDCIDQIVQTNLIEEMSYPLPSRGGMFSEDAYLKIPEVVSTLKISSVVVGMGMSVSNGSRKIVEEVLKLPKPVVVDADGLNNLSTIPDYKSLLEKRTHPTVLTPHIGEFSRLTGLRSEDIFDRMEEVSLEFCKQTNSYLIMKFSRMMIATPNGEIFYNTTGNPGMATAGTGDILAGIVGALINRLDVLDALKLAVYSHGRAGDLAVLRYSQESLKATDLLEFIRVDRP